MLIRPRFTAKRNAFNMVGSLFGLSQNGAILDTRPDNLFFDAARTTPITAPGDPVGGATDLSGNGNHFAQPSDPDRMIYGVVPVGGRRNLNRSTEAFNDPYWEAPELIAADDSIVVGGVSFSKATPTTTLAQHTIRQNTGFSGTNNRVSAKVRAIAGSYSRLSLAFWQGGTASRSANAIFDVSTGEILFIYNSGTWGGVEVSIEPLGGGVYECAISAIGDGSGFRTYFGVASPDQNSAKASTGQEAWEGDGDSFMFISAAQYEDGEPTPYQRVGNQFDVTEAGVRSIPYAHFNLTNQFTSTELPAGTYTIAIAGTKGSWFGEISHAGGAFDVGPTTVTGGPAGLLSAVGKVLSVIPVQGSITASQKTRLLNYFESLGAAPGEVTV